MSIELVSAVLATPISPTSAKLLMVYLAEGTNRGSGVVWRGKPAIAACLGISERAVQTLLQSLKEQRLLEVVANGEGGRSGTRSVVPTYRISLQRLLELQAEVIHTGEVSFSPDGAANPTEGRSTGASRGEADFSQTGIEPLIQAQAVDNSHSLRNATPKTNSRLPDGREESREPPRPVPVEVRRRLDAAIAEMRCR